MNRPGAVLCPIIVGRDDLLQLADRRIAEVAGGAGGMLMLAGDAGVGKTRMLGAILRKATAAGFRVAKGDLSPHDRQVPLASVLDLARTMTGIPGFSEIGRRVLELRPEEGRDTLGLRRRLVHEIADGIATSVDAPALLAFEDLHWADEMSLEVVGELARRARDRPLLVVVTYRLDELPAGSVRREWRSRLLRQRMGEEARLERLTYEETATVTTLILGTDLPAPREVVSAVHRRTNGIPLHIEELLAALDERARMDGQAILEALVPDTIEDAVLARVARLSDDARAVARAGAVVGRCFTPEVLAGVMDRPVNELDGPLQELVADAVLYPFSFLDRGFYDFRHQLLRDALYGSVPAPDLRRFHARAGEFGGLLDGGSEIHASVHFERAGLGSEAYRAALGAARAASAMSSRQEAFELYARAAANAPDDLAALDCGTLHEAYGGAALAVDNIAVAETAIGSARRFYLDASRPLDAARQLVSLANAARRDVRAPEERWGPLDQAEHEAAELPRSPGRSALLGEIRLFQGVLELDARRLEAASDRLDEAAELLGEGGGDAQEALADLEILRAEMDVVSGAVERGLMTLLRAARDAREANHETTGVGAYRVAAALAARCMDYPTAELALREGLRYADAIEQSYCRRILAATAAHVAWAAGRWDDAMGTGEIELVERGTRRGTMGSLDAVAFVAFGRGDLDRARGLLDQSLEIGTASREVELILRPLWGLAETMLLAGEPAMAARHCNEALALAESTAEHALFVPFVVTGARAHLAERHPETAVRWLARAAALLHERPGPASTALEHARGLVRGAEGSMTASRTALERAVAGWDRYGRVWEATWARLDLVGCLLRLRRYTEAVPVLEAARRTASGLGSEPLLARVDELARRGRGRVDESAAWGPLTTRELEVARLIAEGRTNAQIAHELSIAPRTASSHVEHILAKLGVTRRTEIAAWVATVAGSRAATARVRGGYGGVTDGGVTDGGAGIDAAVVTVRRA